MKKEILITIVVIGGLVLLGVGFSLGLNLGKKAMEGTKVEAPLADLLGSELIGNLTTAASGEVTEISGRNLTLSKDGDSLTISIREDAPLYRLSSPEEKATEVPQPVAREEIEFGEIKTGDTVSIFCQLKADASLEGIEIIVLP